MYKRFAIGLLLLVAIPALSYAQYGKISGKIVDRETKEPLVGATVLLEGTTLGASSDINGNYVILNVPAGTYNIKASYVGYHPLTISGVSVLTGLTRDLPIQLASTAVQVGAVEIVAQRPLIEKTATNAVRVVGASEIQNLPVRGAQAYFTIQPGVVLQNNSVYIRGSRADEVGYQIEGASTKNIIGQRGNSGYNGNYITTIPEALQEISVQEGGYSAEFGNANSGIVQQTFKTGGSRWHFTAQGETDNFGNYPGKKFADTYSYGYSDYVVTLGGPVYSDKVKLFLAGENHFNRDTYNGGPIFWSGANFGYLQDNGSAGGQKGDSALVAWNGGNLPRAMNNRYSLNGTMLFDFKPVQVRIAGAFTNNEQQNTSSIYNIFDLSRVPLFQSNNLLLTGKMSYFLSANTFFEVNLDYLDYRDLTTDPIFGTNALQYGDSMSAAAQGWQYSSLTSGPRNYVFYGFPFNRPGTDLSGLTKNHNGYLGGSVNLTSQIGKHEIKVGGSYEYWTVRSWALGSGGMAALFGQLYNTPDSARTGTGLAYMLRNIGVNNYGYDEFGNVYNGSGPNAARHPYFASGYIEDRIEFSDLVINVGLRLDNMNMDAWDMPYLNDPGFNVSNYTMSPYSTNDTLGYKLSRSFTFLEPRLGLSFPVTDMTVFHLQYGKFVQAPQLSLVYAGQGMMARYVSGQYYYTTGDIALNVGPVRTTQYEVGISQQFTDFAAFDATGFYKNVTGQLVDTKINVVPGAAARDYHAFTNGDFETVMGLELSLRVRRVQRLQADLNFTIQDARGTNSFPGSAIALQEVAGIPVTMVTPLSYDQGNRGSVMLDYRFAKNDGGPILEQLGLNLLLTFNSGHPFTLATGSGGQQGPESGAILNNTDPRTRFPLEPVNNSTTPWVFQLDAKLDKNFELPGGMALDVYIYAQNLLNTKNVINVYYRTGNGYADGYLSNPTLSSGVIAAQGGLYVPMYEVINLQDNQNQRDFNGFDNFGMPRQIRVGARLEF